MTKLCPYCQLTEIADEAFQCAQCANFNYKLNLGWKPIWQKPETGVQQD